MITLKGVFLKVRKILGIQPKAPQSYIISDIGAKKWAYISYVIDAFWDNNNLNVHQNRREAIIINRIFNELGYNTYFHDYLNHDYRWLKKYKFDIVFGHDPNMAVLSKMFPNALKIYYSTGSSREHQNREVVTRTDEFNRKYNANIPYKPLIPLFHGPEIADAIIQIGTIETVNTFVEEIRPKFHTIHQSTTEAIRLPKQLSLSRNSFLLLTSAGNLFRGVQYVIDYFIAHPEYQLHWVGTAEEAVIEAYNNTISSNIHIHGFMDTTSDDFLDIVSNCSFFLYPSNSEGGASGCVLLCMKLGLIPIITHWIRLIDFDSQYILRDCSIEGIDEAMDWVQGLTDEQIHTMRDNCRHYIEDNYTLQTFEDDFRKALTTIIQNWESGV